MPPPVYERHRAIVRAAPLLRARGRLERREGAINVLVSTLAELDPAPRPRRRAESGGMASEAGPPAGEGRRERRRRAIAELRAVAPAGHSFGRRGR